MLGLGVNIYKMLLGSIATSSPPFDFDAIEPTLLLKPSNMVFSGNTLTSWLDNTANNFNVSSAVGDPIKGELLNENDTILINNNVTADYLVGTDLGPFSDTNVFIVLKNNDADSEANIAFTYRHGSNNRISIGTIDGVYYASYYNGSTYQNLTHDPTESNFTVLHFGLNSGIISGTCEGQTMTPSAQNMSVSIGTDTYFIGGSEITPGTLLWHGGIAEILVKNSLMSNEDINAVLVGYRNKYNII